MSVVIETTLGDITVDLFLQQRPVTCLNFMKLCKMKFYNFNLFHSIRSGFIAQTGDPSGDGTKGESIFGVLEGPEKRFFSGEKLPKMRHTNTGTLSMVCTGDMMVGSQFFFTLAPDLDSLDGVHCVIGEVTEGHDVLRKLNDVICDEKHRPYRDVRITHTVVLEDPFNDPAGLVAPSRSPSPSAERLKGGRIAPDEDIDEAQGKSAAEVQEMIEEKEAKARATILEIVGDLPDADIAPPENVLFVCKLNPVTTDEDLEIIFSRFGTIVSCEVIRDKKTGDSLQYAFVEFSDKKSCEEAYFKMDNVLIDDRRIHVDFSQSVSKMRYLGKGRGVQYLNDNKDAVKSDTESNRNNNGRTDKKHENSENTDKSRAKHSRKERQSSRNKHSSRDRKRSRSRKRHSPKRSRKSRSNSRSRNRRHDRKETSSRDKRSDRNKRSERNTSRDRKLRSPISKSSSSHHERSSDSRRHRGETKEIKKFREKSRSRSPSHLEKLKSFDIIRKEHAKLPSQNSTRDDQSIKLSKSRSRSPAKTLYKDLRAAEQNNWRPGTSSQDSKILRKSRSRSPIEIINGPESEVPLNKSKTKSKTESNKEQSNDEDRKEIEKVSKNSKLRQFEESDQDINRTTSEISVDSKRVAGPEKLQELYEISRDNSIPTFELYEEKRDSKVNENYISQDIHQKPSKDYSKKSSSVPEIHSRPPAVRDEQKHGMKIEEKPGKSPEQENITKSTQKPAKYDLDENSSRSKSRSVERQELKKQTKESGNDEEHSSRSRKHENDKGSSRSKSHSRSIERHKIIKQRNESGKDEMDSSRSRKQEKDAENDKEDLSKLKSHSRHELRRQSKARNNDDDSSKSRKESEHYEEDSSLSRKQRKESGNDKEGSSRSKSHKTSIERHELRKQRQASKIDDDSSRSRRKSNKYEEYSSKPRNESGSDKEDLSLSMKQIKDCENDGEYSNKSRRKESENNEEDSSIISKKQRTESENNKEVSRSCSRSVERLEINNQRKESEHKSEQKSQKQKDITKSNKEAARFDVDAKSSSRYQSCNRSSIERHEHTHKKDSEVKPEKSQKRKDHTKSSKQETATSDNNVSRKPRQDLQGERPKSVSGQKQAEEAEKLVNETMKKKDSKQPLKSEVDNDDENQSSRKERSFKHHKEDSRKRQHHKDESKKVSKKSTDKKTRTDKKGKKVIVKKKRKYSTTSSSSSSDSSSSSESSTSSEEERKKKSLKRRKKKVSTSSSSSDSSTSSSSSSSSISSSSSSESEPSRKKRKKVVSSKASKKSKKKYKYL